MRYRGSGRDLHAQVFCHVSHFNGTEWHCLDVHGDRWGSCDDSMWNRALMTYVKAFGERLFSWITALPPRMTCSACTVEPGVNLILQSMNFMRMQCDHFSRTVFTWVSLWDSQLGSRPDCIKRHISVNVQWWLIHPLNQNGPIALSLFPGHCVLCSPDV